jgi:hypothetical protein
MSMVLKGMVEKTGVNPQVIEDLAIGNTLLPGAG